MSSGKLSDSWQAVVGAELEKPYMKSLSGFLREEKKQGKVIFPQGRDIFNALNLTAFESVKVVILGQDPYHGEGQAHGLCFSVPQGVPLPPSLKNIFIDSFILECDRYHKWERGNENWKIYTHLHPEANNIDEALKDISLLKTNSIGVFLYSQVIMPPSPSIKYFRSVVL